MGEHLHTTYLAAPPEDGKERFYHQMEQGIARYQKHYAQAQWVGNGAPFGWEWPTERTINGTGWRILSIS